MSSISSEIKPCHLVLHDHHSRWHQLRTTSTGDALCGYGWPTGATNPVATLKHREVCEALGSRILVIKAQGALILGARPVECRTTCVSGTEIRHRMGCLAKLLKSSLLTSPHPPEPAGIFHQEQSTRRWGKYGVKKLFNIQD